MENTKQHLRKFLPASGMVEDAIVLSKVYQLDYVSFSKLIDGFNIEVKIHPDSVDASGETDETEEQDD